MILEKKKRFMGFGVVLAMIAVFGTAVYFDRINLKQRKKMVIAEQYGLAYAPLQMMKELKLLDKYLPGNEVEWKQLGNTAAIREAMVAGEVDVGFMAIPPFLIGFDKGMDWKIASGLSESPVALVTNRTGIQSIKDFSATDRIALPQPGSIQHILLAMACEREMQNAKKLDNLLVALAHPDGMNALLTGKEITAHFTTPPYLNKELENPHIRKVLDGEEVMGGRFTLIVCVTTGEFHKQRLQAYQGFIKALAEAVAVVCRQPRKTARILAAQYRLPESELLTYLTEPGSRYTMTVKGVSRFADFMVKSGYLSKRPKLEDLYWENVDHD